MNHYKHITLSGVQYIQAANEYPQWGKGIFGDILLEQWDNFDKANQPIIWLGEKRPNGTIISGDEIKITEEYIGKKPFESAVLVARPKEIGEDKEQQNKSYQIS